MDHIAVRFHLGGVFDSSDGHLKYVGGQEAMSFVEVDKMSYPEIKGHLADHISPLNCVRLHFCKPGMKLSNGPMLLLDERSIQVMLKFLTEGGVAEIYVEDVEVGLNAGGDAEQSSKKKDKDWISFMGFYRSPSKEPQSSKQAQVQLKKRMDMGGNEEEANGGSEEGSDVSVGEEDSIEGNEDYQAIEDDSSAYDEEAQRLKTFAKQIKRNIKTKKVGV